MEQYQGNEMEKESLVENEEPGNFDEPSEPEADGYSDMESIPIEVRTSTDESRESQPPKPRSTENKLWKFCKQTQLCYLIVCILCLCVIGVLFFVGVTFLIQYLINNEKKHENEIPTNPYDRAVYLAERTPLIDGHNDIIERILGFYKKNISITIHLDRSLSSAETRLLDHYNTSLMTDIPRMKVGHVGCQFWAVYTDCKITGHESVYLALQSFRYVQDMIEVYSDTFTQVTTSSQLLDVFGRKRIGGIPGVEGGQMIDMNLDILREYYRLGARYLTLTHNCNTKWADSCCDPAGPVNNGLTAFGKEVLQEMNRIGMIIDCSHVTIDVMNQALEITSAPIMFSHSNARKLCNSTRNVPDEVLVKLKDNRGIIMVTFVPGFLSEIERLELIEIQKLYPPSEVRDKMLLWEQQNPGKRASVSTVADHIDHIKKIHGNTQHIGIGSDYDGISYVPLGLEDSSKFMFLIEELIKRGYQDFEINQILGENLLRVLHEVESVAAKLQIDSIFKR